jgi:hypothetical protein
VLASKMSPVYHLDSQAQYKVALGRDLTTHPFASVDEFLMFKNYSISLSVAYNAFAVT